MILPDENGRLPGDFQDMVVPDENGNLPIDELYPAVGGITPVGWGSEVKPEFTSEGELTKLQRTPTEKDMRDAASYIQFLTWVFKAQNEAIQARKEGEKKNRMKEAKDSFMSHGKTKKKDNDKKGDIV